MFRANDNALSAAEIALLSDVAHVEPDGLIWLRNQHRAAQREKWNACEVLLDWRTPEFFGVQRVLFGARQPFTRGQWRRRLHTPSCLAVVEERKRQMSAVFPGESVLFEVLGWRLRRLAFWEPRPGAVLTERLRVRIGQTDIHTALAEAADG